VGILQRADENWKDIILMEIDRAKYQSKIQSKVG
jgi:hypothetical protein